MGFNILGIAIIGTTTSIHSIIQYSVYGNSSVTARLWKERNWKNERPSIQGLRFEGLKL